MTRPTVTRPAWSQTIRFRLAASYTLLLFLGMTVVVAVVYAGFAASVDASPVAEEAGKTGYFVKPNGKVVYVTSAALLGEFESSVNNQTLSTLRSYSLVSLAALPFLSAGLGWWLSGRALRPVQRIAQVAREIEATDLSRRIDLEGPRDELHDLADTFDRMLARLDDAFLARQRFVDEASHDLRNPLAVLRTNLEVVHRDPHAELGDYQRATEIAVRAAGRMGNMVEDLVSMARRENTTDHGRQVDLDRLVVELGEEYRAASRERGVEIAVRGGAGRVHGDDSELRRAVGNLLENAVGLAPEASCVALSAGRTDSWSWVAVQDDGPGIPPSHRERVFERTWTTRPGERRGLGLGIVADILQAHGGQVRLHPHGAGSTFVAWLPHRLGTQDGPPQGDPTLR